MTRLLYAFLMIFFAGSALAQTGEINGKVVNDSGEGIPFANVAVYKDDVLVTGASTDFDGNFSIAALTPGTYDVESSYQGNRLRISSVVVSQGIVFLNDMVVSSTVQLGTVEIKYEAPLVDVGNTSSGGVVTKEDIKNIPTRNINSIAATKAGVYQADEGGGINIKGARSNSTEYIVDGIRISGSLNLPQNAIEQLEVVTGGVDAKYGDATGGFVTVTTRGPSKSYNGELEFITSQYLDGYDYNLANLFLTGPIVKQYKGTDSVQSKLGFFLAAEFLFQKDDDPGAVDNFRVKDNIASDLAENPLRPATFGTGFVKNSEFLTMNDLEVVNYKLNAATNGLNITGKFDYRLGENSSLTVGGTWRWFKSNDYIRTFSLLNSDNNPVTTQNTYRGFVRFQQRFAERKNEDGSSSVLGNAYYNIQASYEKFTATREDPNHGDNPFNYGYVGKFQSYKTPVYQSGVDSITGLRGYLLSGFSDTL
ncbi:MAG: hypothetical protein ACI959_000323, partial [Limisphaerales bacterium]